MEERIPLLRGKVGSEAKGMEKRLHLLSQEWEAGRPLSKEHTPSEVGLYTAVLPLYCCPAVLLLLYGCTAVLLYEKSATRAHLFLLG